MPNQQRLNRSGYVLVMTLVIIGLTGMTLARLANHSLALTSEARAGELKLQRRWAVLSCQAMILRDPETLLGDLAASFEERVIGLPHPDSIKGSCRFGGTKLNLTLADEQAKANVNALYDRRANELPGLLAEAAFQAGLAVPIRLRPSLKPENKRSKRYFENLGGLIDLAELKGPNALATLGERFTCWGEPRLNAMRASNEALRSISMTEANSIETRQLLEAREGYSGDLNGLLEAAEIPRQKAIRLKRVLTERSQTHALWIVIDPDDNAMLLVKVVGGDSAGIAQPRSYAWP